MSKLNEIKRIKAYLDEIEQLSIDVENGNLKSYTLAKLQHIKRGMDEVLRFYEKEPLNSEFAWTPEETKSWCDMRDALGEAIRDSLAIHRKGLDALREIKREARSSFKVLLNKHMMEVHHAPVVNLCFRCNKRPRHFDNYCKRCANELGIRPKGKIT